MGDIIWSIVATVGGFGVVGFVFYYWLAERDDRQREEDARAFFDEHGYWPDEA
jgi:hypothetical protein